MSQYRSVNPDPDWTTLRTPARGWYALAVLFLAYALSFVDRTIVSLLVGPIRADLHVSDTQVSLLHGFAFAILYTLVGIPVARLADRGSRRNIVAVSAAVWSLTCAGCGLARNFSQLFLGRIGVGIGEAGLSPAAYSMLADLFPQTRLGLALSIYTSAVYIGAGSSLIIGGAVIASAVQMPPLVFPLIGVIHPWQLTFFVVGLPGLLISGLMLSVREPRRRGSHTGSNPPAASRLRDTVDFMRRHRGAYAGHIVGFTLVSMIYNVAVAWGPTFMIRSLRLTTTKAGYLLGVIILGTGVVGVLVGGLLADRLRRRGRLDATLLVGMISAVIATPAGAAAFLAGELPRFLLLFGVMLFGASMAFGAAAAGIQALTPNRMRAQASAAYLFTLNMLAVGAGPTLTAVLTDFWFRDDLRVGSSACLVISVAGPLSLLLFAAARRPFVACVELQGSEAPLPQAAS